MDRIKLVMINLLLNTIIPSLTPALKDLLKEYTLLFYWKAKETANPIDDVLARFFLEVLGIPEPVSK